MGEPSGWPFDFNFEDYQKVHSFLTTEICWRCFSNLFRGFLLTPKRRVPLLFDCIHKTLKKSLDFGLLQRFPKCYFRSEPFIPRRTQKGMFRMCYHGNRTNLQKMPPLRS